MAPAVASLLVLWADWRRKQGVRRKLMYRGKVDVTQSWAFWATAPQPNLKRVKNTLSVA